MTSTNSRFQVSTQQYDDDTLALTWGDGHPSLYPAVWLLEACTCERCGSTETAVRHVRLSDKPRRPRIHASEHDKSSLFIDWGEGHRSIYPLDWLRTMCLCESSRRARKFRASTWGSEMAAKLPYISYAEVSESRARQLAFLESILAYGFAILRDVPAAREKTAEVTSLVGKLRLTNYEIYELESKPNPEIVGDMALALAAHTDEPYRVDPPAITFFHVIEQAADGGASTLIDSFRLAAIFREQNPGGFELLTKIPARFHRSLIEGRMFEYHSPIIRLDSDGDITCLRLLDRALAPVDCAADRVEPFYDAVRELLTLVYAGEGMIEFRLEAGEMLVFNNQRLMHGRTAFDPLTSKRHIRSCHVDLDEFYSRLRILYRESNNPRRWMIFRKD